MEISRRSPPTKLDTVPKGTVCRVAISTCAKEGESGIHVEYSTYIQKNNDEDDPIWEEI